MLELKGLVNETDNAEQMIERLWKEIGIGSAVHAKTKLQVLENIQDEYFKPITEELQKIRGIYNLEITKFPEWWRGFKRQFVDFLTDNITDELADDYNNERETHAIQKLIETEQQLATISVQQLKEGKFPNGNKIIKHLKKITQLCCPDVTDEDIFKSEWYRTYEKHKTTSFDEMLVLTNSIPSFLGMSSYFENPNHQSCMTLVHYATNNARGIWSYCLDPGSLIAYVTRDNLVREFKGIGGLPHQAMITRYILRLVKTATLYQCPHCGEMYVEPLTRICKACKRPHPDYIIKKPDPKLGEGVLGLMLDRAYPHAQYTGPIMKLLKQLCDENNLKLFMLQNYKVAQHGGAEYEARHDGKIHYVTSAEPIPHTYLRRYIEHCENCSSLNEIKSCDVCNPIHYSLCENCKFKGTKVLRCVECEYNDYCPPNDCKDCPLRPCMNRYDRITTHYDDHAGADYHPGTQLQNLDYKKIYKVHIVKEVR